MDTNVSGENFDTIISSATEILKFWKSKMADGNHCEKMQRFQNHLVNFLMKFVIVMHISSPANKNIYKILKIQDDGWSPFENWKIKTPPEPFCQF